MTNRTPRRSPNAKQAAEKSKGNLVGTRVILSNPKQGVTGFPLSENTMTDSGKLMTLRNAAMMRPSPMSDNTSSSPVHGRKSTCLLSSQVDDPQYKMSGKFGA